MSTMSTVWYTLIFNPNIRDFWKEARLIVRIELVLVVCYIELGRSHAI